MIWKIRKKENKEKENCLESGLGRGDNDQPAVGRGLGGQRAKGRVFQLRPSFT